MATSPSRARVSPTQVSKDVYILKPVETGADNVQNGPQVILLFGWMNAKLRPLFSYMDKYAALYPTATQLLVLARGSNNWSSKTANVRIHFVRSLSSRWRSRRCQGVLTTICVAISMIGYSIRPWSIIITCTTLLILFGRKTS